MPHLEVKLLEGKSEEQKQKLAQELVKAARKVLGYGEESYSVSIQDFTYEEWKNKVYPDTIMANKEILYKAPGYEF